MDLWRSGIRLHANLRVARGTQVRVECEEIIAEGVVWPEGTVRYLNVRGKVYDGEDGRPQRMTGLCWDVTERRLLITWPRCRVLGEVRNCWALKAGQYRIGLKIAEIVAIGELEHETSAA